MKHLLNSVVLFAILFLGSCESSEDISKSLDHQVPDFKTLTLTANGQTIVFDDMIIAKNLWGYIPTINLETVVLETVVANKGSKINLSVVLIDNEALKTVEMAYSPWLASKYINFSNPLGDIPLNPKSYTFTAEIDVPINAVSIPWLEDFYFNDGSPMKIKQPYHKITITVTDINLNKRVLPVYVQVQ